MMSDQYRLHRLDDETRVDMLYRLVIAQLAAYAHKGKWLSTEQLDEALTTRRVSRRVCSCWQDDVELAILSAEIAPIFVALTASAEELIVDEEQLDSASPVVRGIRDACASRLGIAHKQSHCVAAQALEMSVAVLRRAQGKKNSEDFPFGSLEWHAAEQDYLRELQRVLQGWTGVVMPLMDELFGRTVRRTRS
ncbi:hypothetical protein VSR82_37890 [Burkholderia sp. JPY481]